MVQGNEICDSRGLKEKVLIFYTEPNLRTSQQSLSKFNISDIDKYH
ncbi:hypothetical protein EMIT036CA2_40190 [Chryseobacterium sp. IT-36CA2]